VVIILAAAISLDYRDFVVKNFECSGLNCEIVTVPVFGEEVGFVLFFELLGLHIFLAQNFKNVHLVLNEFRYKFYREHRGVNTHHRAIRIKL
jgi:hypothetical protein